MSDVSAQWPYLVSAKMRRFFDGLFEYMRQLKERDQEEYYRIYDLMVEAADDVFRTRRDSKELMSAICAEVMEYGKEQDLIFRVMSKFVCAYRLTDADVERLTGQEDELLVGANLVGGLLTIALLKEVKAGRHPRPTLLQQGREPPMAEPQV